MPFAKTRLLRGYLESHLGIIHMLFDHNGALIRLDFNDRPEYQEAALDQQAASAVCRQLREYLCGTRAIDILLAPTGSAFLRDAWALLREIPYGTTTTYGELAKAMGTPSSARAIGMANAVNPISIIVPCHRVIASTGHLTGYSEGLDKKRRLLALEAEFSRKDLAFIQSWSEYMDNQEG